ncbi:MAG: hypothetical protein KF878_00145 [Planctomycetes bacterium]|nr:hypothetical protein [Planctomycetota bacterium]
MADVNETGKKTFFAAEPLAAYRRVKFVAGSGTRVEYAGAGDEHLGVTLGKQDTIGGVIEVALTNKPGTVKVEAAGVFAAGADLYGAASGRVSATPAGSKIGQPTSAASGAGSIVELVVENTKPTSAGLVSIADAGNFTAATTAEAALQELYQDAATGQACVPVPLASITREDGTPLVKQATTNAGFAQLADKEQVILIPVNATTGEQLAFCVPLPPDLDDSKAVKIHVLAGKESNDDALTLDAEAYFVAPGDVGNDDANDTAAQVITQAASELVFSCGAAGVLAHPCVLTGVLLLGGTNDDDAVRIYGVWIEYSRKVLAA